MSDTTPETMRALSALFARRSGSDRVRMACEMFDLARRLAVADLKAVEPSITEERLRESLLERFYGDDLSEEDRRRVIMTWRRRSGSRPPAATDRP
jgi:hypothetical protein